MDEELLIKYIVGETDAKEQELVNKWLQESSNHQKELGRLKRIWEESKKISLHELPDAEMAWEKFKMKRSQQEKVQVKPLNTSRFLMYKVAAAVILVTSIALMLFLYQQKPTQLNAAQEIHKAVLPDGSKVVLNRNSSLSYQDFDNGERLVNLHHGEVFFDVKPDKTKPFIIDAQGIKIKVLGTSFNVKQRDTITEVIVESGLVSVTRGKDMVKLKAGEKVFISTNSPYLLKQENTDLLFRYYSKQVLIADNTPLWRVVEVLNEKYQTKIVIQNPQLKNAKLNATFKDESLDEILRVIAATFNARITKVDQQQIIISLKE
ncbi:FecR family protein [Pedobacter glucosidilyticus]|uniref:FecR family protein n=1 Tax=Pedobacter glucosidilyticus TaxID=1122941 RepID=UPI0026F24884|nr:FecR domain-containing protein [Pedobacter glucosidilyticus]